MSALLKSWFQQARPTTQSDVAIQTLSSPSSQTRLQSLEHAAAELHRQLQVLLDVQADRLAGLSNDDPGNEIDAVTATAVLGNGVLPVRQPQTLPMSLNAARSGIKSAMRQLSTIKGEERRLIDTDIEQRNMVLQQLDSWEETRAQLHNQLNRIQSSEEGVRFKDLTEKDISLSQEIDALELHLAKLKSRQRAIGLERSTLENSMQSKLSSYRASLALCNAHISDFLKHSLSRYQSPVVHSADSNMYSSDLDMARQQERGAIQALDQRRRRTEAEIEALDEGVKYWVEAFKQLNSLEHHVEINLGTLTRSAAANDSAQRLLGSMESLASQNIGAEVDRLLGVLEELLNQARGRGWNLLVCCVAAELDALSNARGVLLGQNKSPHSEMLPDVG